MSNSWVTSAALTTDDQGNPQVALAVQVDDFVTGETVEISGQATQEGGAFANYYAIQQVPAGVPGADGKKHKIVPVSTHPIPPNNFMEGLDVTVVLRVSRVWVTVLGPQQPPGTTTLPDPNKPAGKNTTWAPPKVVSSIDGKETKKW